MKFLHLSDLHIHSNPDDNQAVRDMLIKIKADYAEHYLIITGDIVDDGHLPQYENAFNMLEPFKGKVFISPGNHDFGAAGNFFSRERAWRFDERLSVPLDQGGTFTGDATPVVNIVREDDLAVMLIALDTNLETWIPFDFACGEVGGYQLGALEAILNNPSTSHMRKLLFFHHHPFIHLNPTMVLIDADKLARVVHGKVDVILFGHKHVSGYWPDTFGAKHVLASDNTPRKSGEAREVVIGAEGITVNDVPVT